MSKSVGNIRLLAEALDEHGRDALVMYFVGGHYRQPIAYSDDAARAGARRAVARVRELGRRLDPEARPPDGLEPYAERFWDALADDFNTPEARAALFDWIAEANRRLDAGESVRRRGAAGDAVGARARQPARRRRRRRRRRRERLLAEREAARAEKDFATRRRDAATSSPRWAGTVRDTADGREARHVEHVIVYGRNAVREALRGKRRGERVVPTSNAAHESWPPGRLEVESARARSSLRVAGPPGRLRRGRRLPYADADALLADEDALVARARRDHDPRNLGAVCRVAECAGVTGVVIPERRAAHVTPVVCKTSAGAVEHLPVALVRNVADYLGDAKEAGAWVYGADAGRRCRTTSPTTPAASCSCSGARGGACGRASPTACDELVALPIRGKVESLNVAPRRPPSCTESCIPPMQVDSAP